NYHEYNDKTKAFGGMFDGDGHVIELLLNSGGIFGSLYGATIKNVALIGKDLAKDTVTTGRYALIANQTWSGQNDLTVIDNVYGVYDLDVAVISNYQSWGRYSGLSFVSHNGYYIKYTNSILDFSDLQISDLDNLGSYGFVNSVINTDTEKNSYRNSSTNNYFITSLPSAGRTLEAASNAYTGEVYTVYGANQTEQYTADTTSKFKYKYNGINVYADYTAMKAGNHDYSSYNTDIWTIKQGEVPVFTAYAEYARVNDIKANTEFYFAGAKDQTSANIGYRDQVSAYASYGEKSYAPTLTVVEGDSVSTQDGVITAIDSGVSTIKAVYDVEGVAFEKTYTITVTLADYTVGKITYSTLDNELYLPDFGEEVVSIANAGDKSIVYYANGAHSNVPTNNTNAIITTKAIVSLANGDKYYVDLESYTMIIMQEEDLAVLVDSTATSAVSVAGYYLVGADIKHGTWTGNTNTNSTFTGVFDGNGHYVELKLNSIGLFGKLNKSTIKNTAFIINEKPTNRYIFATATSGNYYVDNVYIDVNVAYASTTNWTIAGTNNMYQARYSNTIIDYAPGTMTFSFTATTTHKYGGGFENYTSSSWFTTKGTDFDGDGVEDNAFNYASFKNTYIVSGDYKYVGWHNGGTAGVLTEISFAENDGAVYASVKDTISSEKFGFIKGLRRYDDFNAMAQDGNSYTTFNADVWEFSAGYPRFKSVVEKERVEDINANTKFYLAGAEGQETAEIEILNQIDAIAVYNEKTYIPTLSIKDGSSVELIGNNTIKAVDGGISTVVANYNVDGVEFVKEYVINVTIPNYTQGKVMYSTLDNKLYMPDFGKNVISIVDANNPDTVYYTDGVYANITANLTNNVVTVNAIVSLEGGMKYYIDINSYTKVLTTAEDLLMFNIDDGDTLSGSSDTEVTINTLITGYYILGKDIVGTTPLTFKHADMLTTWNNTTTGFAGVFDGDGHKVTVTLTGNNAGSDRTGIFGQLQAGAVIKNVAFVDCVINRGVLLFSGAMNNARNVYLQNVYVSMTTTTASTYGGSAWYSPGYINVQG
ncbi:MAG: hypothetical protein J6R83_01565, partial [Clostridia bacterium]|nr:hypothetical protein [Clostridia bacterium]